MSEASRSEFWQDASDYHGVLCSNGALRLAVSPNGARYLLQSRGLSQGRVIWGVIRWRKQMAKLVPDLPPELAVFAASLPDNPADLPRPWADAIKAQGLAVRQSNIASNEYAGVIAAGDDWRLIISNINPVFVAQVPSGPGWAWVAASKTRDGLRRSVAKADKGRYRSAENGRKRSLLAAVESLPETAAEKLRSAPPPLADVVRSIKRNP